MGQAGLMACFSQKLTVNPEHALAGEPEPEQSANPIAVAHISAVKPVQLTDHFAPGTGRPHVANEIQILPEKGGSQALKEVGKRQGMTVQTRPKQATVVVLKRTGVVLAIKRFE
jgi:hypothetical protein